MAILIKDKFIKVWISPLRILKLSLIELFPQIYPPFNINYDYNVKYNDWQQILIRIFFGLEWFNGFPITLIEDF